MGVSFLMRTWRAELLNGCANEVGVSEKYRLESRNPSYVVAFL